MDKNLEWENYVTLIAVQSLLGLISSTVIAAGVEASREKILLTFWAHAKTAELEEDIEDAVFEMEALLAPENPLIETVIHAGQSPADADLDYAKTRMIYWAKDSDA